MRLACVESRSDERWLANLSAYPWASRTRKKEEETSLGVRRRVRQQGTHRGTVGVRPAVPSVPSQFSSIVVSAALVATLSAVVVSRRPVVVPLAVSVSVSVPVTAAARAGTAASAAIPTIFPGSDGLHVAAGLPSVAVAVPPSATALSVFK